MPKHELALKTVEVALDKAGAKDIWEKLQIYFPTYALFRADRPSVDSDAEVQDPMKLAVKQAIAAVEHKLDDIRKEVETHALDVANRTLQKLNDMSPDLARQLKPKFSAEPRWEGFRLTLADENDIPINKRGSGVRRLILLNFFRAEAERRASESDSPHIICAIEEPEVSQHPENQEMLVNALLDLSSSDGQQVIVTTHVPRLAGLLPVDSIRHLTRDCSNHPVVQGKTEDVLNLVAEELGVLPDLAQMAQLEQRLKLLICVEGPTDVEFLKHVSSLYHSQDSTLPNFESDGRIAVFPLYGSNLGQWVERNYFKDTGVAEYHIYDQDADKKYQSSVDQVNARDDSSCAVYTDRLNIECYFHHHLVNQVFGLNLDLDRIGCNKADTIDAVIAELRQCKKMGTNKQLTKTIIKGSDQKKWRQNAKYELHKRGLPMMSSCHLHEVDKGKEILGWCKKACTLLAEQS